MKERIKKPIVIAGIAAVLVIVAVAAVLIGMKLSKKEAYRNIEIIECMGESIIYRADKGLKAYEEMKLRSGDTVSVKEGGFLRMKLDEDKYV